MRDTRGLVIEEAVMSKALILALLFAGLPAGAYADEGGGSAPRSVIAVTDSAAEASAVDIAEIQDERLWTSR
jgi:hypothetical protein